MARGSQYYRGKRKKRNRILIPTAILLGLISLVVVLFYGMQKYVVISKDKIHIDSPILEDSEDAAPVGSSFSSCKASSSFSFSFSYPSAAASKSIHSTDAGVPNGIRSSAIRSAMAEPLRSSRRI